jgi:glycosyltransferase involved in cell wall biosynthesis
MTADTNIIRVLELRSVRGTGGGPEKTILLGAAQASARYDITVCYIRDARDSVFHIDHRATPLGIDYIEIVERHSFDRRVWRQLRSLVRQRGIHIVHSHDYKTDLLALLLQRVEPVSILATAHGWTGHSMRERILYYPVDKRLLRRFKRVVAVSGEIRREIIRAGATPEAITVVLNGIDPGAFRRDAALRRPRRAQLGIPEDAAVIGAVGRLEPQKRFDLLIDAFAQIHMTRPDVHLVIAGDGSLRTALQTQIAALGLQGCCGLIGHVQDVRPLHAALDLFVQSSDYEGTSNAVLEAMALETPIVATDVGGTAEQVMHDLHGLVIPPGDVPRLRAAIESVLTNPSAAATRAAAARQRVEESLSFAARVRKIEAIYDELAPRQDPWPSVPALTRRAAQ